MKGEQVAYETPVETYNGKIKEVKIGADGVTVGGESTLPFYSFEGESTKPLIALEVYDFKPDWPAAAAAPFADVLDDPVAWAKKCVETYGAEAICLQLKGADPNGLNKSVDECVAVLQGVEEAVNVPIIVWGCGNADKDTDLLKKVAEVGAGKNILIGPAVEENFRPITAASMGYQQNVVGQTPNDVNMAKQLNILITQLGQDPSKVVMDPTTGALGYGLEYTFTVMERLKLAALTQNDAMAQMPIISDLGKEVWRSKEVITPEEDDPSLGNAEKRGILWEALTAITLMLSGANILVMRHPEAMRLVKETVKLHTN